MSSIWRQICKVVFWIAFAAEIILDFVWANNAVGLGLSEGVAALLFFVVLIAIAVIHSLWGAALEFFDNVAKIKNCICISDKNYLENKCGEDNCKEIPSKITRILKGGIYDNYIECECGYMVFDDGTEYCPECGKKLTEMQVNDGSLLICECGKELTGEEVFCMQCGKKVFEMRSDDEIKKICKCGRELINNEKFCVKCGRKVE